jgi:hypothetical protein
MAPEAEALYEIAPRPGQRRHSTRLTTPRRLSWAHDFHVWRRDMGRRTPPCHRAQLAN